MIIRLLCVVFDVHNILEGFSISPQFIGEEFLDHRAFHTMVIYLAHSGSLALTPSTVPLPYTGLLSCLCLAVLQVFVQESIPWEVLAGHTSLGHLLFLSGLLCPCMGPFSTEHRTPRYVASSGPGRLSSSRGCLPVRSGPS